MESERTVGTCDCCATDNVPLGEYHDVRFGQIQADKIRKLNMCDVCAGTFIGNVFQYFDLYRDEQMVAKIIAQCTWLILKAIKGERVEDKSDEDEDEDWEK